MQRKIFGREHLTVLDAIATLELATEEGSILQIDYQDFQDAICLCGSSPACFRVSGTDISEVIQACREELLVVAKKRVAVAIAVICGYGNSFNLARTTEVISSLHDAVGKAPKVVYGVRFDPALVNGMSVTWLIDGQDT